jgi:large repetitive protein
MLGSKPRTSRAASLGLVAATGCLPLGAANAQAATVTVGSPLTGTFGSVPFNTIATVIDSSLPEAGSNSTSPVTGTIVRWRITGGVGGPFSLRVLTVSGGSGTGAGTSAPQTPAGTATQTYPTSMPISAGQTIGIDNTNTSDQIASKVISSATIRFWVPPLADGQTRAATGSNGNQELGFNADVQPFPSVSSLSPSSGPPSGGTTVTITGQNFSGTTAVNFGSTPAKSFTVMSDNVITAVAPASSASTVDVTVKNPGQSPTTAADRFTFAKVVKCVVPKLKGKTLKKARKALKKAHCKLGKVKGPKGKKARIKKQKPKPGTVLKAGSKVRVTTKRKK